MWVLVGFNAGKSTLLSVITAAKPRSGTMPLPQSLLIWGLWNTGKAKFLYS